MATRAERAKAAFERRGVMSAQDLPDSAFERMSPDLRNRNRRVIQYAVFDGLPLRKVGDSIGRNAMLVTYIFCKAFRSAYGHDAYRREVWK